MTTNESATRVKTTENSLEIVDIIQKQDGATLSEIFDAIGLAKSTVYKHLCTLTREGYLVKEGGVYHIGLKFHHRGEYARLRKQAYRLAGHAVNELTERTNEEIDFVVENDGRTITVFESYHPSNPYREDFVPSASSLSRSGTYYHMHCTAGGKAILAEYEWPRVETILAKWGLPARTDHTITTEAALHEDLKRTRERGYAVTDGEYAEGLRAIGMAVMCPDGNVLGGLSMSVPTYRQPDDDHIDKALEVMRETVEDLETEIAEEPTDRPASR